VWQGSTWPGRLNTGCRGAMGGSTGVGARTDRCRGTQNETGTAGVWNARRRMRTAVQRSA
jgi:hypothetical protein